MPSQRKRIGFLPSEEVHEIIDKICNANGYSQSKVTGLLVEEALKSRGILRNSFSHNKNDGLDYMNNFLDSEQLSNNNKSTSNNDVYSINNKSFSSNIKMMHEFIEFKYFKKIMRENNNIFE